MNEGMMEETPTYPRPYHRGRRRAALLGLVQGVDRRHCRCSSWMDSVVVRSMATSTLPPAVSNQRPSAAGGGGDAERIQ